MPVTKRNPKELLPVFLALASAVIAFGIPSELTNSLFSFDTWLIQPTLAVLVAVLGIIYGNLFVNRHARSIFVWLGVAACILLIIIESFIFLLAYGWRG